jgi:hypothetical protein
MAQITLPQYPKIIVDTAGTLTGTGSYQYNASTDGGRTFRPLPSTLGISPEILERDAGKDGSESNTVLDAVLRDLNVPTGEGGIVSRTIGPALQSVPGLVVGSLADMGNLVLENVDVGGNVLEWAFGGFEGDVRQLQTPQGPQFKRYLSSDPADVFGSSAQINAAVTDVGNLALRADQYLDEKIPTFNFLGVEVPYDLGATDLALSFFKFNPNPDVSTKTRKYISLITQIIGSAPVEGALIAKLAIQLAKTTTSPTAERVYEAISEMQVNSPIKAAALETSLGATAGGGMVASDAALEAAYPNAPQWMKNTIMAGGAIAAPIAGMTVGSVVYDTALKIPIVSVPLRFARGATASLTVSGAERAAANAMQKMGGDWKNRSDILGVMDQLKLALAQGRDIDEVTRIAMTTPQLARNEARILDAQLNASEKNMPPTEVAAQRQLIEELRRFSNFQEGHLATLTSGGNIGATAYTRYSQRMIDRRDKIFAALNESILKMDLGGKVGDDIPASVIKNDYEQGLATGNFEYNVNRIRGFQEGKLTLEPEQAQAITQAYDSTLAKIESSRDEAIRDAEERVLALRDGMPEDLPANSQAREDFNLWIRREIDTAYKEIDGYEDILWNNISGLDRPKTDTVTNADGTDLGPQILIDGKPIGAYFAAKEAALLAGEDVNQSKYLWMLAGRDALVEQASKGGGPDAEKVAKQNVVVKSQEAIVVERQRELDRDTENLTKAGQAEFADPKVRDARAEVARLEAELGQIPTGQTIEDPTVIRRINAVNQKLIGARANLTERSKDTAENPALKKAQDAFEKSQTRLNESQIKLDTARGNLQVALNKGVDFEGIPVKLEDVVDDNSILGVKTVDGVSVGRTGQDVYNVISNLKREMSGAQGGANRNPQKVRAIGGLIDDLQRAIADQENFSIDTTTLGAAIKMTAAKKAAFEKGTVGRIRGFTKQGETQVPVDRTIEKIVPVKGQETSLRDLENALTRVATGEGTPFRLVQTEDGGVVAKLDPDFNLERYATAPPAPFQSIQVNGGRSLGLKVAEGIPKTEANIKLIQDTLWDRFRTYGAGDEFDSRAAAKWIDDNSAAINWLKNATGETTGFENITAAERVVSSIKTATQAELDKTISAMRKDGAFNEQFTEEGFRILVKEAATRESNLNSAATFLNEPSPLTMGEKFFDRYLNDPEILKQTLKVLENGELPNGTNPALDGFKQAVGEELVQRGQSGPGEGTDAAVQATTLSQSMGGQELKVWDPQKLFGLAGDPKIGKLLGDLFGPEAAVAFQKVAEGARLQSTIGPSATKDIRLKDIVSDEWAGNLGRILGGLAAKGLPISSLVLTGLGRRYGINTIGNVRGQAVENLIVEFLMDPKLAMAAVEKWPSMNPNKKAGLLNRAKIWAHQKFISDNVRRVERFGERPGTLFEVGARALGMREPDESEGIGEPPIPLGLQRPSYQGVDEGYSPGPQTSLQPPARRMAANASQSNRPSPASALSQVNPVGPPTGPSSQEMVQRGRDLFGPNDPIFAAHGGYLAKESGIMSVPCKPRQLVG